MAENEDDLLAGRKSVITCRYQSSAVSSCINVLELDNQISIVFIFLDLTEFVANIDAAVLPEDQKAVRKSLLSVLIELKY